jgi:hypothetical protein
MEGYEQQQGFIWTNAYIPIIWEAKNDKGQIIVSHKNQRSPDECDLANGFKVGLCYIGR